MPSKSKSTNAIKTAKPANKQPVPQKPSVKPKSHSKLKGFGGVLLVAGVNILSLFAIFAFVAKLPTTAREFNQKKVLSEQVGSKDAVELAQAELSSLDGDIKELSAYYPTEAGLVAFVSKLEELKLSSVVNYSFATDEPVRDIDGALAVPIVISFAGSWTQIDADVGELMDLKYVIRVVETEARQDPETGLVTLKFGGFLYVNEHFSKN